MSNNDIPDFLKQEPNLDDEKYKDYEKYLLENISINNFSLYDEKMANDRKTKGYYYMEVNFFSDLLAIAQKYIKDLPDIALIPRRYFDFTTYHDKFKEKHIIFADELMPIFLTNISCGAFYMSATNSQIQDKKRLNRLLVTIIDVFVCRHKDNAAADLFTVITENDHSTKFACFMQRAMYSFILCHEIAHIALQHSGSSLINEFDADALGYEIFYSTILNADNLKYLEFFISLRRAPLALFDILDVVKYYQRVILDKEDNDTSHPEPILRKAALLDQFDFGDDEECFNLYLVISERMTALKYYIYKYKDVMREKIKEIHLTDLE
jgi:hypothetical protein